MPRLEVIYGITHLFDLRTSRNRWHMLLLPFKLCLPKIPIHPCPHLTRWILYQYSIFCFISLMCAEIKGSSVCTWCAESLHPDTTANEAQGHARNLNVTTASNQASDPSTAATLKSKEPAPVKVRLDQKVKAVLGVRGIWVLGSCRRQKIASHLLEAARSGASESAINA